MLATLTTLALDAPSWTLGLMWISAGLAAVLQIREIWR